MKSSNVHSKFHKPSRLTNSFMTSAKLFGLMCAFIIMIPMVIFENWVGTSFIEKSFILLLICMSLSILSNDSIEQIDWTIFACLRAHNCNICREISWKISTSFYIFPIQFSTSFCPFHFNIMILPKLFLFETLISKFYFNLVYVIIPKPR